MSGQGSLRGPGHALRLLRGLPQAAVARLRQVAGRGPRFAGIYRHRAVAERAALTAGLAGYDHEEVAPVSFEAMCRRAPWDYPALFWLGKHMPECRAVTDAGGHMGTKYIAFSEVLDLSGTGWTVYDLPGIIRAARLRQGQGGLPPAIRFE
ncbi:MAG: hypothetical protein Q4G26_07400, partial [Paracoccus sp. (in: a-proteobacteria)]|nr:hypothetical protein [Paracoccus sp. (in: a-proteobacteria)]